MQQTARNSFAFFRLLEKNINLPSFGAKRYMGTVSGHAFFQFV